MKALHLFTIFSMRITPSLLCLVFVWIAIKHDGEFSYVLIALGLLGLAIMTNVVMVDINGPKSDEDRYYQTMADDLEFERMNNIHHRSINKSRAMQQWLANRIN